MSEKDEQKWSHKEIKKRINRLKTAEKELQELDIPGDIFSAEVESIRVRLKSVPDVEDVEIRVAQLKQKVARHHAKTKEAARPQVTVELDVDNYSPGEWKAVDLGVVNQGKARAQSVEFQFSDEVEVKWLTSIAELEAGAREVLKIGLKSRDAGDIPLDVKVSYKDVSGKDYSGVQRFWLKVSRISEPQQTVAGTDPGVPQLENYTLERKIGSGGFADVYLAQNTERQIVAVKIPRLSGYETVEAKDFLSEAELWEKLSKQNIPYIVKLYEYGTAPYPWIAMEYMDGGSLRERMARLEYKDCLEIAMRLMEALHSAHHYGVIHRDIKPENVLFDSQGIPRITDWGLGKVLLEASMSSIGFRGTLAYSAPEQLAGSRFGSIDWRTDIYQMGMMVYEMLTGELPFSGTEAGISVTRILNEPLPAPSEISKEISTDLNEAVLRATAKRKEDRFQSMDAFKDRLEQFLKAL